MTMDNETRLAAAVCKAGSAAAADRTLAAEWDAWLRLLRRAIRQSAREHDALVDAAYWTFCRTLRGFSALPQRQQTDLKVASRRLLEARVRELCRDSSGDRAVFDAWHEGTCDLLRETWAPVFPLYVGQAQKWVNVLLKYHAAFGDRGLFPEVRAHWLDALHTPIDVIVYRLLKSGPDLLSESDGELAWFQHRYPQPWSRMDSYEPRYMSLQRVFRRLAQPDGIPPCAIELVAWQGDGEST